MPFLAQLPFWSHFFCILLSLCQRLFFLNLAQNLWGNQKLWCHEPGTSRCPKCAKTAWPQAWPRIHVMTSTFNTFHFHLKPPFELVRFVFSSLPLDKHLAQRKPGNTRGNLIWPKLKHGVINCILHEARFISYRSFFNMGPPYMWKLVCIDKMHMMVCKTTRFHSLVTLFTLVLTHIANHDFPISFTRIHMHFTCVSSPTHSLYTEESFFFIYKRL